MLIKQYIAMVLPFFYLFPTKGGDYGVVGLSLAFCNLFLAVSCVRTSKVKLKISLVNVLLWILLLMGTTMALFVCAIWLTTASSFMDFIVLFMAVVEYGLLLWSLLLPLGSDMIGAADRRNGSSCEEACECEKGKSNI